VGITLEGCHFEPLDFVQDELSEKSSRYQAHIKISPIDRDDMFFEESSLATDGLVLIPIFGRRFL
jgi:hypothetical protein